MFEKVIEKILNKILGKYIYGIDSNNLNLGILGTLSFC